MARRLAPAALLLCALVGTSAMAQEISALDLLRKRPASAFDVGFVKLERMLNRIENPLWSYTYDMSDYGDDFESYSLKYPAVDYRYGYPLAHRESGKLVLVGVALAQGKFRSAETCGTVMAKMREEILVSETTAGGSQINRARSFIERTFGIEEPWTDDDASSELADHLLEEVVLELRLYEQLPSDAPDAICRGFLHHDTVEYQP